MASYIQGYYSQSKTRALAQVQFSHIQNRAETSQSWE